MRYIRTNRRHVAFTLSQRERFYIVQRSIWKDRVTALRSAASHEISRCATTLYANRTPSSRLLSCSLSSEVLNFIFGPLVAVPPVYRVARQVADIFSVILHSRPPRRSLLVALKKREKRLQFHSLPATFPHDDNTSAIDNRNDIISEKEIPSERGIFGGAEQYRKNCFQKENNGSSN